MLVKHGQGRLKLARPAKPLKPRGDLGVIQVRMIAAAGADQLVPVGVAALDTAVHDADRLVPQDRLAAATEHKWTVIDMAADWATIHPDA